MSRRAMLPPILPSPTIPTCIEASSTSLASAGGAPAPQRPAARASRLDGPTQEGQSGLHVGGKVDAQGAAPTLLEHLQIAAGLGGLHHAERVAVPRHRE